jgi:hypothetical protein
MAAGDKENAAVRVKGRVYWIVMKKGLQAVLFPLAEKGNVAQRGDGSPAQELQEQLVRTG